MEFPGFPTLIQDTLATYKKNLGLFAKLIALSFALMLVVTILGIVIGVALIFLLTALNTPGLVVSAVAVLIFVATFILVIYTQSLIQIGFIKAAANTDTISSIKDWLMENKPLVVGFWLIGLLNGFIVLGGFWLLLIPAIILGIWFSLSQYIYVFENVKGMNALLKSREYVRGVAGPIFLNFLILQIIMTAFVWIPTFIFNKLDLQFLTSIYSFVFQLLATPIGVIFTYQMYKYLRSQKKDVPSEFSRTQKNKYLLIGFITPIIVILLALTGIWAYTSFMQRIVPEMNNDIFIEDSLTESPSLIQ